MTPYLCKLNPNSNFHINKIGIQYGKLSSHSWSGSRVPYIEKNRQLLGDIKKELKEKRLLEYEPVINQYLHWSNKQLLKSQIEEYNEGYYR